MRLALVVQPRSLAPMSDPLNRKPWPMKWVFVVILACIVPYTILTLKYRKTAAPFQPYEDSKQRANVIRLLDAGYQRIQVSAERPADPQLLVRSLPELATPTEAAGGLTEALAATLVEIPELPLSFNSVAAPGTTKAQSDYPVVFTCKLGDQKHQLGGAEVFVRGGSMVIVPRFEALNGELTARSKESAVVITLPGGTLRAGTYRVHLAGRDKSRQWNLEVR
jgi:hypothetical protein